MPQKQEQVDGAPQTAIYKDMNGTWRTIDDVTTPGTRHALGLPPLEAKP